MPAWTQILIAAVFVFLLIDLVGMVRKIVDHLAEIRETIDEMKSDLTSIEDEISSVRRKKEFRAAAGFEFE